MRDDLNKLIKKADWKGVLDYLDPLSSAERYNIFSYLIELDINTKLLGHNGWDLKGKKREDFFENRKKISSCLDIAILACTRNSEEVKKITTNFGLSIGYQIGKCLFSPDLGYRPIIYFFSNYSPNYLDSAIKEITKERFSQMDFKLLWKLHENGWVSFDEELFVMRLFTIYGFDNNHFLDANFQMANPEALTRVFLQFYKYEIPVLDLIKAETIDYKNGLSAKASTYWSEVFKILLKNGLIPRSLLKGLLESLLNNWKKPHLNWHVSLILLLSPTKEEYIEHQKLLFALLNSDNVRTLNFAVEILCAVYQETSFDHESFIASAPNLFIQEKVDKALAKLLSIVEFSLDNHPNLQKDISQHLSLGLLQVNTQTQAKFATLLMKYTPETEIETWVEPYTSVLKIRALEILGMEQQDLEILDEPKEAEELKSVSLPQRWDDLLFHIGTCIKTKSACDIDLFFEGLIQLQDSVPEDYQKQLRPYQRQLNKRFWEIEAMLYFKEYINNWCEGRKKFTETVKIEVSHIPFLRHKSRLTFNKLQKKDKLSFLSTPTHLPFFVHPDILVDRLLKYEEIKESPDLEDLIVAINRILKVAPSNSAIEKVKTLKSDYRFAIQYLLGVSDTVQLDKRFFSKNNKLLPLWSQVCRTKNPDKTFLEFTKSKAVSIPTVVEPFYKDFRIEVHTSDVWTWYRLKLADSWNNSRWYVDKKDKPKNQPVLYYYAAPHGVASRADILYQISLLPNYTDGWLCRYLPDTASGNEVAEFEQCQYPIQALLDYKLKVYHGGWLYIAQCLVFEKKISRELAAQYISFSLKADCIDSELLAKSLAVMLAEKYAPVKRLTDYIEKPGHNKALKELHLKILANCILEGQAGKLPNSFKKVVTLYRELSKELKTKQDPVIGEKLKVLKK